jgi:hypothetical protein
MTWMTYLIFYSGCSAAQFYNIAWAEETMDATVNQKEYKSPIRKLTTFFEKFGNNLKKPRQDNMATKVQKAKMNLLFIQEHPKIKQPYFEKRGKIGDGY